MLLCAVEFEEAVDVDLVDPMLDGCRCFLRAVLFLVFAVTQLTLDLYVSPFSSLATNWESDPQATQRCQSVPES